MSFADDSRVTGKGGRYEIELQPMWEALPGVIHGGFLAAVALRSLGAEVPQFRPLSAQISFLHPARLGRLELTVVVLRGSKRSSTLRVDAVQDGTVALSAVVACGWPGLEGFEYPRTRKAPFKGPAECPLVRSQTGPAVLQHVEFHSDMDHTQPAEDTPYYRGWTRLNDSASSDAEDAYLDAGRLLFLSDLIVATPLYIREQKSALELPYITPSLDLYIQFHAARTTEWVMLEAAIAAAHAGTLGVQLALWSEQNERVATAASTLLCRPNPFASNAW